MAWQQPKTNWDTHPKAIEPIDLNRIESNIEVVREQSNMPLLAQIVATLPAAGTPGRLVFCTADNRFYFDNGTQWQVQSAPNLGQVILTAGPSDVPIPEGYHDGSGYVAGHPMLKFEAGNKIILKRRYKLASSMDDKKVLEIKFCKAGIIKITIGAGRGQGRVRLNGKAVESISEDHAPLVTTTFTQTVAVDDVLEYYVTGYSSTNAKATIEIKENTPALEITYDTD